MPSDQHPSQQTPQPNNDNQPRSVPFASEVLRGLSFADAQHGWLSRGSEVWATEDGGHKWQQLYSAGAPHQLYGVQRLTRDQGWYASDQGLFTTADGAKNWSKVLESGFLYGRFTFVDKRHGWVSLYPPEFKATQDGGKTWNSVQNPCGGTPGPFSFITPSTGWVVCPTGGGAGIEIKKVFRTDDGAQSWTQVSQTDNGLPASSYSVALFFLDSNHGWLGSAKGDLLTTRDGGKTWQALPRLGDLTEIRAVQFFTPEKGYIIAADYSKKVSHVLETTDGGQTWTELFVSPSAGP
jgi:photosystem II stability/assembly factor-like uncharacterized protein